MDKLKWLFDIYLFVLVVVVVVYVVVEDCDINGWLIVCELFDVDILFV